MPKKQVFNTRLTLYDKELTEALRRFAEDSYPGVAYPYGNILRSALTEFLLGRGYLKEAKVKRPVGV